MTRLPTMSIAFLVAVTRGLSLGGLALLLAALLPGCAKEAESLYAEKHVVPAHWPESIGDAAAKLAERMNQLQSDPTITVDRESVEKELIDLIEWTPEIVADSNVLEEDWLPIYDQCEKIRKALRRGNDLSSQKGAIDALVVSLQSLVVPQAENKADET